MFSMTRPRFEVAKSRDRRKTFGNGTSWRGPESGPKKMTVGCVIFTVHRRKSVSHAVTAETESANTDIVAENGSTICRDFQLHPCRVRQSTATSGFPGRISKYSHNSVSHVTPFALPQATFFLTLKLMDFRTLKLMEIHFAPETEKKLKDLAAQGGRKTADELVQDVIEGYFEEPAQTRTMLNRRFDDLKSGRVKPIPGDEVEAYFRDKSAAARRSQPGS
jgi:hypothetical protein